MTIEEEKALKYFYNSSKKALKDVNVKGLARKSCFQFVTTIKDLSRKLEKINNLKEVLNYED